MTVFLNLICRKKRLQPTTVKFSVLLRCIGRRLLQRQGRIRHRIVSKILSFQIRVGEPLV